VSVPSICSSAVRTSAGRAAGRGGHAQIGVARAAFFPALTLSGSGGYESDGRQQPVQRAQSLLVGGPVSRRVLFDGGARAAAVAQARALDDSQVATYRQTVLNAFQSVEDNLAALRILATDSISRTGARRPRHARCG